MKKQTLFVSIVTIMLLSGCASTKDEPNVQYTQAPVYQQNLYQHHNTRLVGQVSQGPNAPTMPEREALTRFIEQLNVLMPLIDEAERNRRPDQRLPYRYDWLKRDVRRIQEGIREYLTGETFYPSDYYQSSEADVSGQYQLRQ